LSFLAEYSSNFLNLWNFYQPFNQPLMPLLILVVGFFLIFSISLLGRTALVYPTTTFDVSFAPAPSFARLGFLGLVAIHLGFVLFAHSETEYQPYDLQLLVNPHSFIFKFLVDISYGLFLIFLPAQSVGFEFLALTFLSYTSSLTLFESADLISFFLLLEFQTIPGYILLALRTNSLGSLLASMNYFILGASSTLLTLLGLGLLYGVTGLLDFNSLSVFLTSLESFYPNSPLHFPIKLAFFFLTTSFLFKFGLFPFHTWLVQVYTIGYLPALLFLSWIPKFSLAAALFFLWGVYFSSFFYQIQPFLLTFGLVSSIGGALFSLLVPSLNLAVAYLAVSSGGFFFLLLSSSCDPIFFSISFLYASYSISVIVPLLFFLFISDPDQSEIGTLPLSSMSQLIHASKATAFSLAGIFYSVAGLPPTAGFWLKLAGAYFLSISLGFPVAFFSMLLISLLNLFLFLRVLSALFFYPPFSESLPTLGFNSIQISFLLAFSLFPYFVPTIFVETLSILFFHLLSFSVA
jgi:NADH-quinone oxidoreductase subunit N